MGRVPTIRLLTILALALCLFLIFRSASSAPPPRARSSVPEPALDFERDRSDRMREIDLQVIKYRRAIELLRKREDCYAEAHDARELRAC